MGKHEPQPMDRQLFRETAEGGKTCMVCFMAEWSQPSREMNDIIADITHKWYGSVPVYVVDPDEEPFIMSEYSVNAVPAFIIFRGGREAGRIVGLRTFEQMDRFIEENAV